MEREFLKKHKNSSKQQVSDLSWRGEDEVSSCKTRRRLWCLATKSTVAEYCSNASKSSRFQSSANEIKNLSVVCQPSAFWSRSLSRPAKPAVFGTGESIKHIFRVLQVYRFQNYQITKITTWQITKFRKRPVWQVCKAC